MKRSEKDLAGRIKDVIIEMVHYLESHPVINYSQYISHKLKYDYTYLSNIFSQETTTTIEQCIIAHKIERVKQLLIADELTLTQIAARLHYSSVAHLSNQFKKVTGITSSEYKGKKNKKMPDLDKVCN